MKISIKKLYRLHRVLSTVLGIPVLLWALSGLMHPLMTTLRPRIATQSTPVKALPDSALQNGVPLKKVLNKAGIAHADYIRVISLQDNWYYQVLSCDSLRYFSILKGDELLGGDLKYSAYLASHYLSGEQPSPAITSIQKITHFTTAYAAVNRLLPVIQVSFDRPDGIQVFVSTRDSKFSFAADNNRNTFNQLFAWLHTWSWLDELPRLKAAIIAIILLLTLLTATIGIYLAIKTKAAKASSKPIVRAKRLHRITASIGAIFMLAWAFSGLVHAIQNARPPDLITAINHQSITTDLLPDNNRLLFGLDSLGSHAATPYLMSGARLFNLDGQLILSTTALNPHGAAPKDLLKSQAAQALPCRYFTIAAEGSSAFEITEDQMFSKMASLAFIQTGLSTALDKDQLLLSRVAHFSADYNFADKILPVLKVQSKQDPSKALYIDPQTVSIVKKPDTFKAFDAYSFAFFHKHEFMAWAGKSAKDTSTILGILILITLLVVGYRLVILRAVFKRKK